MGIKTDLNPGKNRSITIQQIVIHIGIVYHMLITAMDRNIQMVLIEHGNPGP